MNDEGKQLLNDLINSLKSGNQQLINDYKYKNLFFGTNLLSVVTNYIFLERIGIDFDFGTRKIVKGTHLFRIRKWNENIDFNNPDQWSFPPLMQENRANKNGEPALYLGTTENICVLETHIKKGEKYVLGEYVVKEDIVLGGFLKCEDYKKISWYLAGVILNAFFIAPSRGEKNTELFKYLDLSYKNLEPDDLCMKIANDIDLPLKFGVINKKEEFYKVTNSLIESIKFKHPEGLCYSSCYIPVSTIGITCSDHNVVLFNEGINKIMFMSSQVKTNNQKFTDVEIIKLLVTKDKHVS